jgi:hypothetical protein
MAFKGKLISSGSNAKTVKGDGDKYETAIMYLAPFTSAGHGNVCAMAETAKCIEGCLNTAGRAAMFATIPAARKAKTTFYMTDRPGFLAALSKDVEAFVRYCAKRGVKPCVRLNGTSDIMWEKGHPILRSGEAFRSIMEAFPEVQFYDYTKIYKRADKSLPVNYSLTLSYSRANVAFAAEVYNRAYHGASNMAVVFRNKDAVKEAREKGFFEFPSDRIIDGDETDMRFLDPQGGYVVALYAKGKAKGDRSGFVVG